MKISLFTQILQRKGFPVNQFSILLKQQQQIQEHNYAAFLEKKKAEIVRHHSKENANYKHFIGNTNISEWNNIPIMTKKDFQKPLSLRLSNGYSKNNVYINKTSGSSGDPFFFAKDKFCHALTWANIIDKFGAHGIDFNTSFQARFYGIPLDFKGNLKEQITFYLDLYQGVCRKTEYKPDLASYPTPAFTLSSSYNNITDVLTGKLNPMTAMMTMKLKVTGSMAYMMRNMPTVLDFVRCAQEVTTDIL